MRGLIKLLLVAVALFLWVSYRSGAFERVENRVVSDIPGVPDRVSVTYHWDKDRFMRYLKSFKPQ